LIIDVSPVVSGKTVVKTFSVLLSNDRANRPSLLQTNSSRAKSLEKAVVFAKCPSCSSDAPSTVELANRLQPPRVAVATASGGIACLSRSR
jgi:hypothetical protein